MTSTEMNMVREKTTDSPDRNQARPASRAMAMTMGTKYPETMSAILAMGALEPWASSTSLMIRARAVSLPTWVALNLITPFLLRLAPMTLSPGCFSTGMLSPVSMDSSTEVRPSMTSPSTGIFSPGFTRRISPTSTSSMGISISLPS